MGTDGLGRLTFLFTPGLPSCLGHSYSQTLNLSGNYNISITKTEGECLAKALVLTPKPLGNLQPMQSPDSGWIREQHELALAKCEKLSGCDVPGGQTMTRGNVRLLPPGGRESAKHKQGLVHLTVTADCIALDS